ncbi:MAG: DNA (cytosine-5-)-methyltransferase [candidate division SR1 bacterium]|nr:MAG: DNA (cytosine-5-)-methyltransferase [candidate division SR1 bacterium]
MLIFYTMRPITVLSLFDGMSCGRLALERAGIPVRRYFASEIDKYAIQVATKNFPDIHQIGNAEGVEVFYTITGGIDYGYRIKSEGSYYRLGSGGLDLLIGGSPCQGFSNAGKGLNFEDHRSKLFFEFVRILNEAKPRYFLLENVPMKEERIKIINQHLGGIQPMVINSSLVSAQNRERLYRIGKRVGERYKMIYIPLPEDKKLTLKDILQDKVEESYYINQDKVQNTNTKQSNFLKKILLNIHPSGKGMNGNVYNPEHKSPTLTTNKGEGIKIIQLPRGKNIGGIMENKTPTLSANLWQHNNLLQEGYRVRRLTPIECERLQTLPDNYTEGVSNSQRYKMLGNGWTVDVIAHIFREMFRD